ncbi:hypothetical protein H8356DRAFT_927613 [Neocallimastix lanati (nom. inval.)]|nr:hypothetical protein H8356DRAFT_927613 [Neocallimastix sp. JGI-2020a]
MDNYIDFYIDSFVSANDRKDYSIIKYLIWNNNENNKWDIFNEMYIRSVLSIDRFQFVMKYFSNHINISLLLIKNLFNDNNNRLLDVIFDHIKIYDNEFIKKLLFHYNNKLEISISDLNQCISLENYKILTFDSNYHRGGGKYLLIECNRKKEINITKV